MHEDDVLFSHKILQRYMLVRVWGNNFCEKKGRLYTPYFSFSSEMASLLCVMYNHIRKQKKSDIFSFLTQYDKLPKYV